MTDISEARLAGPNGDIRALKTLRLALEEVKLNTTFTGVYFLVMDEAVIYCGQAVNIVRRIGEHADVKAFDRVLATEVPRELLTLVEYAFSRVLLPRLNVELAVTKKPANQQEERFVRRHLRRWGEKASVFVRKPRTVVIPPLSEAAATSTEEVAKMLSSRPWMAFKAKDVSALLGISVFAVVNSWKSQNIPIRRFSSRSPQAHWFVLREDLAKWGAAPRQ